MKHILRLAVVLLLARTAAAQTQINESQVRNLTADLAARALIASPSFTGVPLAPTAAGGTNTTQIATTAFVQTANATNANLTGPVTSVGNATTITDAAVTLAKLADLAQDQFIGRTTASTGVPQTATITAAARTVLDDTTVAAMVDTLGGASSSGTGGLARLTSPIFTTPNIGSATGSISGNAATVTTNANLTGPITSTGNATAIAAQTGTGTTFVMNTSPTLVTPVLGVASATSISAATHTGAADVLYQAPSGQTFLRTGAGGRTVEIQDASNNPMLTATNGSPSTLLLRRTTLAAGTTAANTGPLKFTSGPLLTTPVAGNVEFLTDAWYGTITTGAARKTFAFLESPTFTGTVTAPTFAGALTGNVTGNVSGSAGSATLTAITDDTTTNATMYPTWVTTASGNQAQKVSSSRVTFNPVAAYGGLGALAINGTPGANAFALDVSNPDYAQLHLQSTAGASHVALEMDTPTSGHGFQVFVSGGGATASTDLYSGGSLIARFSTTGLSPSQKTVTLFGDDTSEYSLINGQTTIGRTGNVADQVQLIIQGSTSVTTPQVSNLTNWTANGGTVASITAAGGFVAGAPVTLKSYTVGTLPAGVLGMVAVATDLLTPSFLATAVGGGAVVGPVFYNGAAWVSF